MENKKSNTGLIVTIVVLVMLLLFGGTLLVLSSMGYLSYDANNVKEEEKNENDDVKEDDENLEIENPKVENQENSNQESQEVSLNGFKISFVSEDYNKSNNIGVMVIKNRRTLPIIESDKYPNSANKIAAYLKQVSDKYWNSIKKSSDDYIDGYNDFEKVNVIGVELKFYVRKLTDKYVSFELIQSGGMGGVTWYEESRYIFDIESGEQLNFSSICIDESKKDYFYNYVINEIASNPKYYLDDNWKDTVKKYMFEFGYWYFNDNGIEFNFGRYSLGPGSNGVITVEVPYSEANKYLKDKFKG